MHVIHANSALSLLFICFERVWVVQRGAWCITRPSGSWSYMDSLFKKRSEKILTASASTLESTNLALALQCDFWLSKLLQQGLLVKGTHFFIIICSPMSHLKPVWLSFICGTWKETFCSIFLYSAMTTSFQASKKCDYFPKIIMVEIVSISNYLKLLLE